MAKRTNERASNMGYSQDWEEWEGLSFRDSSGVRNEPVWLNGTPECWSFPAICDNVITSYPSAVQMLTSFWTSKCSPILSTLARWPRLCLSTSLLLADYINVSLNWSLWHGYVLSLKRELIATFRELGPPDLCHVVKSQKCRKDRTARGVCYYSNTESHTDTSCSWGHTTLCRVSMPRRPRRWLHT